MIERTPGSRICGHLELVSELPETYGASVFGRPVLARDDDSGSQYWLTFIDGRFFPTSIALSRFMANANALTVLRHPDLVRIGLVDREETYCVVGTEVLPGAHVWAEREPSVRRTSTFDTAVAFTRGLAHLHQRGIIHGLFCAGNAVRWDRASLIWQFGLAALLDRVALAQACDGVSDTDVLAPELSAGQVSPAGDVFHWGQTVAELLTGTRGLEARSRLESDFPPPGSPLLQLTRRALRHDPAGRPSDALAVLEELEAIGPERQSAGGSVASRPPRMSSVPPPLASRPPPLPASGRRPPPPGASASFAASHPGFELDSLELATLDGQVAEDPVVAAPSGVAPVTSVTANAAQSDEGATPLAMESAVDMPVLAAVLPGKAPYRVPRRPGPHGPAGTSLAVGVALLAPLLVLAASWQVFGLGDRLAAELGQSRVRAPVAETELTPPLAAATSTVTMPDGALPMTTPPPRCPAHMVAVDSRVCIDVAEYPGVARLPRTNVTLADAKAGCAARSARLCSLAQWRAACSGPVGWAYPYGATPSPDHCNTASLAGFAGTVAPGGVHERCVSETGAVDMVGNVGEWVEDGRVVGGDASTLIADAACDASAQPPASYRGADVGFRCCLDLPAP